MAGDKAGMRVALVGQGISRSLTPAMHEAEGWALGLNYSYSLIDTSTRAFRGQSLPDIVEKAQADGLAGLNITHPYKIEIVQYLDDLSDVARRLGAVNTVVFRNGKRVGYNTDYSGFTKGFNEYLGGVAKDRVLLMGAGGAGAAVAFALMECGARELLIHDINTDQSKALVQKLQAHYPLANIRSIDILDRTTTRALNGIVNATPMGMAKYPGSAFPLELLSAKMWVADIVYFPLETRLLARARALGCRVMPGSGMAVWQAVHAFGLFTGHRADPARLTETFKRLSVV